MNHRVKRCGRFLCNLCWHNNTGFFGSMINVFLDLSTLTLPIINTIILPTDRAEIIPPNCPYNKKLNYLRLSSVWETHAFRPGRIYWNEHREKINIGKNNWLKKVNIDKINWEKLGDRSAYLSIGQVCLIRSGSGHSQIFIDKRSLFCMFLITLCSGMNAFNLFIVLMSYFFPVAVKAQL